MEKGWDKCESALHIKVNKEPIYMAYACMSPEILKLKIYPIDKYFNVPILAKFSKGETPSELPQNCKTCNYFKEEIEVVDWSPEDESYIHQ